MEQKHRMVEEIMDRFEISGASWPIRLEVVVERGETARTRGFQKPFSGVAQTVESKQQIVEEDGISPPGQGLIVGDVIRCRIRSPYDGWLHLFNLGSGGEIQYLVPSRPDDPGLFLRAGQVVRINSKPWREDGPPTAVSGLPETFLAVVTREKMPVRLSDLHLLLADKEKYIGTRGGFSGVQDVGSVPFDLPADSWGYAILKMEVFA